MTFDNLPSTIGWEGTVTARTYNPASLANGLSGTTAIAYPGSLFFESANTTLVATIRDTRSVSPTPAAGALRTNLGLTNTDLNGTGPVDIDLSFFDVTEGSRHKRPARRQHPRGGRPPARRGPPDQQRLGGGRDPGERHLVIAFVDIVNPTTGFPTIEGYVNILDGGTQDGAYFEMKCADTDFCGN